MPALYGGPARLNNSREHNKRARLGGRLTRLIRKQSAWPHRPRRLTPDEADLLPDGKNSRNQCPGTGDQNFGEAPREGLVIGHARPLRFLRRYTCFQSGGL